MRKKETRDGQADLFDDHLARRLRSGRERQVRLGRARRGSAWLRQRPLSAGRHVPFRTPDVRRAGRLETLELADQPPYIQDFAEIWRAADKVVYSKTLETAASARTRIERDFEPEAVRQLKATAERDLGVGGPDLAAQALEAGVVDEIHLVVAPVVVGGGVEALPDKVRLELELLDERRFGNGMVHLRYRTRT
jgi:riboflavin biosynthesis pyrimidine reductase